MSSRLPRASVVRACAACAGILLLAAPPDVAATPPFRLDVLLTISQELPALARRVLAAEAERIWEREGVAIRWAAAPGGEERPHAPLRVLVIARADSAVLEDGRWAVAELLPHTDGRALALASISGARRVLDAASHLHVLEPAELAERRLGLILGRAIAHEVGHFLLATATHATNGLMRATIGAGEFAAMRGESFALDRDARSWIREQLRRGILSTDRTRTPSFSYAAH